MCGRFVQKLPLGEIRVLFGASNPVPNAPPRYNAAPTDTLAVVRCNPKTTERSLDLLRWGLVPLWAKDISFGVRCINGRAETLARTPAFRDAFERRRCLVPADAFYEWQKMDGKTQPHAIVPADGGLFAFAGLWERWRIPQPGKRKETAISRHRSEEHTSELQSRVEIVCRLLLEKKKAKLRANWFDFPSKRHCNSLRVISCMSRCPKIPTRWR